MLSLLRHHRQGIPTAVRYVRLRASFSTSDQKDDKKEDKISTSLVHAPEVEATSRSIGQVIFLNSQKSGNVILASLGIADPTLAVFAMLGAATSVGTSKLLGLDKTAWKNGLWGYNGALIGCASSVFISSPPFVALGTVAGAMATPFVSASLKSVMSMPQWTWSFNLVMLTGLVRSRPLLKAESSVDYAAVEHATTYTDVLLSPLTSISQIFVVNYSLTGIGILAATSLYSPGLALHALGGGTVGCLTGMVIGADITDVASGLWGYNSALTSMAIGTFYVDSMRTRVLSCGAAAGTAVLFGGMSMLFGVYGVPCLTLPFCGVASGKLVFSIKFCNNFMVI